jgi:hypothetical protein
MQSTGHSRFLPLPIERYTLRTTLSEEEVLERLRIITRTTDTIRFSPRTAALLRSNYDYQGTISGKNFEIWRSINYRNTYLPIIKGVVNAHMDETEIRIAMDLSILGKAVTILFLITGIIAIAFLAYYPININTFIPCIIFLANCLAVFLGFKLETRISKKDLNKILKAEINALNPNT